MTKEQIAEIRERAVREEKHFSATGVVANPLGTSCILQLCDEADRLREENEELSAALDLEQKGDPMRAEVERLRAKDEDWQRIFSETNEAMIDFHDKLIDAMRENDRLVADLDAKKWINVNDRLPPSGEHVLLLCEVRPSQRRYVCDGYYVARKSIVCNDCGEEVDFEYDEDTDEFYLREGYYEVIKNWDDYSSIAICDFTIGWMPQPEIPCVEKWIAHTTTPEP